jgi:hypothetical protein
MRTFVSRVQLNKLLFAVGAPSSCFIFAEKNANYANYVMLT